MPCGPRAPDFFLQSDFVESDDEEQVEDQEMAKPDYGGEAQGGGWAIGGCGDGGVGTSASGWGADTSAWDAAAGTSSYGDAGGSSWGPSWQDRMFEQMSRLSVAQEDIRAQQDYLYSHQLTMRETLYDYGRDLRDMSSTISEMQRAQERQEEFFRGMWPSYPHYPPPQ